MRLRDGPNFQFEHEICTLVPSYFNNYLVIQFNRDESFIKSDFKLQTLKAFHCSASSYMAFSAI